MTEKDNTLVKKLFFRKKVSLDYYISNLIYQFQTSSCYVTRETTWKHNKKPGHVCAKTFTVNFCLGPICLFAKKKKELDSCLLRFSIIYIQIYRVFLQNNRKQFQNLRLTAFHSIDEIQRHVDHQTPISSGEKTWPLHCDVTSEWPTEEDGGLQTEQLTLTTELGFLTVSTARSYWFPQFWQEMQDLARLVLNDRKYWTF